MICVFLVCPICWLVERLWRVRQFLIRLPERISAFRRKLSRVRMSEEEKARADFEEEVRELSAYRLKALARRNGWRP